VVRLYTTCLMTLFEAVDTCFTKYVVFRGRASRSEYWWFNLFVLAIGVIVRIFRGPIKVLSIIIGLAIFPPLIAVAVRRLHDLDRSGVFVLLPSVPLFAIAAMASIPLPPVDRYLLLPLLLLMAMVLYVVLMFWFCQRGTVGPNRFGDDPIADSFEARSSA